jgi:hypothetical protein
MVRGAESCLREVVVLVAGEGKIKGRKRGRGEQRSRCFIDTHARVLLIGDREGSDFLIRQPRW